MKRELSVRFVGVGAHAAGAPEQGRSALDAMLLCFQGLSFLREHMPVGAQLAYRAVGNTGPCNIVHQSASCVITLDARAEDMDALTARVMKILDGACLMTETTTEIAR